MVGTKCRLGLLPAHCSQSPGGGRRDPRESSGCSFIPGNGLFQSVTLEKLLPTWRNEAQAGLGTASIQGKKRVTEGTWGSPSNTLIIRVGKLRPREGLIGHRVRMRAQVSSTQGLTLTLKGGLREP